MICDPEGVAVTQRTHPSLALLRVHQHANGYAIIDPNGNTIILTEDVQGASVNARVWDDEVATADMGKHAADFFSNYLGTPVRLVFMPTPSLRPTDERYAQGYFNSLSDGYPYLLAGSASLCELNERMTSPVGMNRFRPNFIVRTEQPFEEDRWSDFTIGEVAFRAVKPCSRCIMVTVDPETGTMGKEPLRTLATFRTQGHKVMFGQNCVSPFTQGIVRVGDRVSILSEKIN
jgi:uncharacterized protein